MNSSPPDDSGPETREASLIRGAAWAFLAIGLVFGIHEALPFAARKLPWRYEKRAFGSLPPFNAAETCHPSTEANALLGRLVKRIYPIYPADADFSIEVSVLRGHEVNAFAFLAGRIYVYDGLIQDADSPDELAAILAHEIEHVKERHVIHGLIQKVLLYSASQLAWPDSGIGDINGLISAAAHLKFGRGQEADADRGALERLRDSRVNVAGFRNFFRKRMKSTGLPAIFSDHPSDEARFRMADTFKESPAQAILLDSEWRMLKNICSGQ